MPSVNKMLICINGEFVPKEAAVVSVFDHGFLYSDGFYDTMKSFDGVVLDLETHMERISTTLTALVITLPWTLDEIRSWIEKMATSIKGLSRVRLTITRGENDFDFTTSKKPTLTIIAEPIQIDPKIYTEGVKVITFSTRRVEPQFKLLGVTGMAFARREVVKRNVFEALFVNDGFVREGSITNLFIVKNGQVFTPESEILKGITRREIFKSCKEKNIEIVEKDLGLLEVMEADEIFLSNTKFGVTPVVCIDDKIVGDGKVGRKTKEIMAIFNEYVDDFVAKNGK